MAKQSKCWINGEPHRVVVLLVKGRDEHGRPKEAEFIHDDDRVVDRGRVGVCYDHDKVVRAVTRLVSESREAQARIRELEGERERLEESVQIHVDATIALRAKLEKVRAFRDELSEDIGDWSQRGGRHEELAFVLRRNSGAPAERYAQALTLLRAHVAANRTETARACAEIAEETPGQPAGWVASAIRARFLGGEEG